MCGGWPNEAMSGSRRRRTVSGMSTITARASAAMYNPVLWAGELRGMRAHRRDLLAMARGRTLELGSGTGLNVPLYPDTVDELILSEPVAPMRKRLEKAARRRTHAVTVLDASAERLPLPDGSLDTVVSTLVLCTVDRPDAALAEIKRVLRPGGRLLFLEHVRADSARLAAWQDRLETPWRRFGQGCRCNRATVELIEATGFTVERRTEAKWRAMPAIVRPIVSGIAIAA
jgi:ubiquinone/menaquinone biosynthesis C-methylase UbiE